MLESYFNLTLNLMSEHLYFIYKVIVHNLQQYFPLIFHIFLK